MEEALHYLNEACPGLVDMPCASQYRNTQSSERSSSKASFVLEHAKSQGGSGDLEVEGGWYSEDSLAPFLENLIQQFQEWNLLPLQETQGPYLESHPRKGWGIFAVGSWP